jgi:hypothetical protein
MKTRILLIALLTAFVAAAGCKKGSKKNDDEAADKKDDEAKDTKDTSDTTEKAEKNKADFSGDASSVFLWEVEGPKGSSYLFGTIHLGVDAKEELPKVVWDKLEAATTFAMEANLADLNPMELMGKAIIKSGKTLDEQLSLGQFDLLAETLEMPPATVKTFQPWFATTQLGVKMFKDLPLVAMDMVFEQAAKDAKKELVYLEEASYQMDLLMEIMTAEALAESLDAMIEEGLDSPEKMREFAVKMVEAYKAGDMDFDFGKELTPSDETFTKKLIVDRNKNWIPAIEKMVEKGGAFIAMGVGHLLGDDNVRALLEKKGYKLTRVASE